jgi:hypothetical protein
LQFLQFKAKVLAVLPFKESTFFSLNKSIKKIGFRRYVSFVPAGIGILGLPAFLQLEHQVSPAFQAGGCPAPWALKLTQAADLWCH